MAGNVQSVVDNIFVSNFVIICMLFLEESWALCSRKALGRKQCCQHRPLTVVENSIFLDKVSANETAKVNKSCMCTVINDHCNAGWWSGFLTVCAQWMLCLRCVGCLTTGCVHDIYRCNQVDHWKLKHLIETTKTGRSKQTFFVIPSYKSF